MKDSEEPKRSMSLKHSSLLQQGTEPVVPYLNRNTKVVSIFYPGDEKLHPHFDLWWSNHNTDQCQHLHRDLSQNFYQKSPRTLPLPRSS